MKLWLSVVQLYCWQTVGNLLQKDCFSYCYPPKQSVQSCLRQCDSWTPMRLILMSLRPLEPSYSRQVRSCVRLIADFLVLVVVTETSFHPLSVVVSSFLIGPTTSESEPRLRPFYVSEWISLSSYSLLA